ncbi:energy transducer TonB [Flavobacterium sp. TMP13]|uniref:energy transducer TonB n=1 Tax=unclassified Flavobacterium TaxID=196869 RepID=UPI00076BF14B|nr:energy transducer TonB [Flavobacterium sp. TAB 87]KVV14332.1 Gram-negative bacterial tonB protein [Flavobacterium sp. TAB 87]
MRKYLFHVLFCSFSICSFAQSNDSYVAYTDGPNKIIYFDADKTPTDPEKAESFRVIKNYATVSAHYYVSDYYKSGSKKMIGTFLDNDGYQADGQFIYYYESGAKQSTVNYFKGKKIGKEYNWYENQIQKSELEYLAQGELEKSEKRVFDTYKTNQYWDSTGVQTVKDGHGEISEENDQFKRNGAVENGLRNRTWTGKNKELKFTYSEEYQKGKLISGKSIDSLNIEHTYTVAFIEPSPKKGRNSFYNYIANNVKVPSQIKNTAFGKIMTTFVVDVEGNIKDIKIFKGIHPDLNDEVIKTIKKYGAWNPGILRGIPIESKLKLPLTFKN